MGRSEPPFIYDRPTTYSFYGPTDPGFNPKAVTQASRTRQPPKPTPKGPLVNINRHPDSWGSLDAKSTWTPMSPHTKSRVTYARRTQLLLRVFALLGALGSLFCSIVINNVATTVIWIIRAAPIVAILHTLYAIYHLCRSPVTRPPASQASYGLFASTLDAGLIPFYVFTAFMAHGEYSSNTYHWGTLFDNNYTTVQVAEATFICALANGGLHFVSLLLSIFLAAMFRKISHLPPDMNPLEDNLTARPRKNRKETDVDEKHLSSSTLHSSLEDPLIGPPRSMPFTHTRGQSFASDSNRGSMSMVDVKRQSVASMHPHRLSHLEPSSPEISFHQPASQPYDLTSERATPGYGNVFKGSPEIVDPGTHARRLESRTADRSNSVSPMSGNWAAYPEHSASPVSELNGENDNGLRQSSSAYSGRTISTTTSQGGNGFRDWFAYGQKPASIGSVIPEDTRGEYESLATHEHYGNEEVEDDGHEKDLGDRRFNIFPDPEEHDHDHDDERPHGLPFNPLMLNPPTPQPIIPDKVEDTDPVRRSVLGNNTNIINQKAQVVDAKKAPDSPKTRYYGNLNEDGKPGLDMSRHVSAQEELTRKPTKLTKKRNKKLSAYQSLKKDDSDDEGYLNSPGATEGDRKGRVVSNSGADTAGLAGGVGASLSSYGSYIAGLGVGRRRDVSGKVAEEGRSLNMVNETSNPSTPSQNPTPTRAAGWARFAGL